MFTLGNSAQEGRRSLLLLDVEVQRQADLVQVAQAGDGARAAFGAAQRRAGAGWPAPPMIAITTSSSISVKPRVDFIAQPLMGFWTVATVVRSSWTTPAVPARKCTSCRRYCAVACCSVARPASEREIGAQCRLFLGRQRRPVVGDPLPHRRRCWPASARWSMRLTRIFSPLMWPMLKKSRKAFWRLAGLVSGPYRSSRKRSTGRGAMASPGPRLRRSRKASTGV